VAGGARRVNPRRAPRPPTLPLAARAWYTHATVGELIAFAEIVRMRRQRAARAVHVACQAVIAASVVAAREALAAAPPAERRVRTARLRKLEALDEYVGALG
jgi:hypothetical protein